MIRFSVLSCVFLAACLTEPNPCRRGRCEDAGGDGGAVDDAGAANGADAMADGGLSSSEGCVSGSECSALAPRCMDGECVRCEGPADCSEYSATPACDVSSGSCVECAATLVSACDAKVLVCKSGGTECVECNTREDCRTEQAPHCGSDNKCSKCQVSEDCARWDEICDDGQCVQCTTATEVERCPDDDPAPGDQGPACDPVAKTCTGKSRGTVSGCDACISDSECMDDQRCLPMDFAGARHGTYCLQIAPVTCPAGTMKQRATSVLGVEAQYCFPVALTTCEALNDFTEPCSKDADCGAAGIDDGLCVGPDGAKYCTYECGSDAACFSHTTCTGTAGAEYCNPN